MIKKILFLTTVACMCFGVLVSNSSNYSGMNDTVNSSITNNNEIHTYDFPDQH